MRSGRIKPNTKHVASNTKKEQRVTSHLLPVTARGYTSIKSGFTLVELLVSMFLILSITSVVMTIFVAGLRGTSRSTVEVEVSQNGDFALAQISRMIRNAKSFDGLSVDGTTDFVTSCYAGGSNEGVQEFNAVRVTAFDGGVSTIACPMDSETAITSKSATLATSVPLTDPAAVTVSPDACYFTCQQDSPTEPPLIGVLFTITSKKISGPEGVGVDQVFQTTVIPRNYLR